MRDANSDHYKAGSPRGEGMSRIAKHSFANSGHMKSPGECPLTRSLRAAGSDRYGRKAAVHFGAVDSHPVRAVNALSDCLVADELRKFRAQRFGNASQNKNAWVAAASLDSADIGQVQLRFERKLLLG